MGVNTQVDEEPSQSSVSTSQAASTSCRPLDWPTPGSIDTAVHDLAHECSNTERWCINGHLTARIPSNDGTGLVERNFSFFAAFLKFSLDEDCYVINWALFDVEKERYYTHSASSSELPKYLAAKIEAETAGKKDWFQQGLLDVLNKGTLPLPDRGFEKPAAILEGDSLKLDFGGHTFSRSKRGEPLYNLNLSHPDGFSLSLELVATSPVARHGSEGVISITERQEDNVFQYFVPRLQAKGEVTLRKKDAASGSNSGETLPVEGSAWYEHQFDGARRQDGALKDPSHVIGANPEWVQATIQLSNGVDITAITTAKTPRGGVSTSINRHAITVSPESGRVDYPNGQLEASGSWVSLRTGILWPTSWRLQIDEANVDIQLEASTNDQEFITLIRAPAYWQGRVKVTGTFRGEAVTGVGFIEQTPSGEPPSLDTYLARMGKEVWREVEEVVPANPTYEQARATIGSSEKHFMEGLDTKLLAETVFDPIRVIAERGGKTWRAIGMIAAMEAIGGNIHHRPHWISVSEIVHVGALIVDDVEDRSDSRRNGPTCHAIYGEAIAINAGTAAYFLGLSAALAKEKGLSAEQRCKLYDQYFAAMRAGHVGQAFDIKGLEEHMSSVVEHGDGEDLEARILCTHRLKTAVGPSYMCRIACILVDASDDQTAALSGFFEALGLAFQIMDDVQDMRGHPTRPGYQDIATAKITHPISMAMCASRNPSKEARASIWERLRLKADPLVHRLNKEKATEELRRLEVEGASDEVLKAIRLTIARHGELEDRDECLVRSLLKDLEGCGAIDASIATATRIWEEGWTRLDAALPDSRAKVLLWALSKRLIEGKALQ